MTQFPDRFAVKIGEEWLARNTWKDHRSEHFTYDTVTDPRHAKLFTMRKPALKAAYETGGEIIRFSLVPVATDHLGKIDEL